MVPFIEPGVLWIRLDSPSGTAKYDGNSVFRERLLFTAGGGTNRGDWTFMMAFIEQGVFCIRLDRPCGTGRCDGNSLAMAEAGIVLSLVGVL